RQASPPAVVGVLLVYFATRALNGEVLKIALARLGHHISRYEAFMINIVMTYTNLLLPRAGLGAPALYLKVKHRVSYTEFGCLLLPNAVLQVLSIGVAGLVCQARLWCIGEPLDLRITGVFAFALAASTLAARLRLNPPASCQGRFAQAIRR